MLFYKAFPQSDKFVLIYNRQNGSKRGVEKEISK